MVYIIVLLVINSCCDHGIDSYVFCTNCCKNIITCTYLIFLQQTLQHGDVKIICEPNVSQIHVSLLILCKHDDVLKIITMLFH